MSLLTQAKKGNTITGPAQVMPMDRDVLVLRKVNWKRIPAGIIDMLATSDIAPGIPESRMPWFADGYVANDSARHAQISKYLIEATIGFAVARTDNGEIIKTYKKDELAAADFAVANARTELAVLVDLADEDALEDEDDDLEDLEDEDPDQAL